MPIWVRLLGVVHKEERGLLKRYQPGDWIQATKMEAARWIAEGKAEALGTQKEELERGCGIVAPMESASLPPGWEVTVLTEKRLVYPRTLFLVPDIPLVRALIPVGFNLLDQWDMAVPIHDYDELLCDIGEAEERIASRRLLGDLRVLAFEPGAVFVKDSPRGRAFVAAWSAEKGDPYHALARALWRSKPLCCYLPITWLGRDVPQ